MAVKVEGVDETRAEVEEGVGETQEEVEVEEGMGET